MQKVPKSSILAHMFVYISVPSFNLEWQRCKILTPCSLSGYRIFYLAYAKKDVIQLCMCSYPLGQMRSFGFQIFKTMCELASMSKDGSEETIHVARLC